MINNNEIPPYPFNTVPEIFWLYRKIDNSGVSGTGYVAVGVILPTGTTILEWIVGTHRSIEIHRNVEDLMAIHGHDGDTIKVDLIGLYTTNQEENEEQNE